MDEQSSVVTDVYGSEALSHLSDQIDLLHGTVGAGVEYLTYIFAVLAIGVCLLAVLVGYKIARGR